MAIAHPNKFIEQTLPHLPVLVAKVLCMSMTNKQKGKR
jgi:hypothetical protein